MTPQQFDKFAADPKPEILCHSVHIETGNAIADTHYKSLSIHRRTAYCVEVFFGLICNGGFDALFTGAYQWTIRYSADALRAVGLVEYATVMDSVVNKVFPNGIPDSDEECRAITDELWEEFEGSPLEEEYDDPFEMHEEVFWELHRRSKVEFRKRPHSYICANKEAFCDPSI